MGIRKTADSTAARPTSLAYFFWGGWGSFISECAGEAFLFGELKPDRGQAPGGHASPDGLAPGGLA